MNGAAAKGQTDAMFRFLPAMLLLACALMLPAKAETRAWLDRDRIHSGETATLNIETDQAGVSVPDWSPLQTDFEVSGHTSTRRVEVVNGDSRVRSLFAVALRPRREGVVTVPSLQVGGEATDPLALTVLPAQDTPAHAGAVAFIEAELDTGRAWVQQAIGYVLRLHYATPLVSGQLEQPQPEGATLQRIGDDVQYSREIAGRRYSVVERRFLLVPERSGTLEIPAARFQGRGTGSFFDDVFGSGPRSLRASGEPQQLEVLPMPDGAPRPWLPLRALEVRLLEAPKTARVGEAVDVVVELRADGAIAAQLPDPQLRAGGAQVFAEPSAAREQFDGGRPQAVLTRRFSIVPDRAGTLQVEVAPLQWWDTRAGAARSAAPAPLSITVAASAAVAPDAVARRPQADDAEAWIRVPGVQGEVRPWAVAAAAFALLWLGTLIWALQRRPAAHSAGPDAAAGAVARGPEGPLSERSRLRRLRLALDTGELGEVAQALCALAVPPAPDLDALAARLADRDQKVAVDRLQRARWAGGDPGSARAEVREAFAKGPRWRASGDPASRAGPLPPLYPD